jgi:hypothetical protein
LVGVLGTLAVLVAAIVAGLAIEPPIGAGMASCAAPAGATLAPGQFPIK